MAITTIPISRVPILPRHKSRIPAFGSTGGDFWDLPAWKKALSRRKAPVIIPHGGLDCPSHFIGTQAPGAGINAAGLAVYDCLHTHYIGFPGSVGTSVRVRNLNPKRYAFSAEITFCHNTAPPLGSHNVIILADSRPKSKLFFKDFWEVVKKP